MKSNLSVRKVVKAGSTESIVLAQAKAPQKTMAQMIKVYRAKRAMKN